MQNAEGKNEGNHTVEVIHPCYKGLARVVIDGVEVSVKIHHSLKNASERGWLCDHDGALEQCPLCSAGTWVVMRFDNPEIRKHPDYKAIWKECFFALGLNLNKRGYGCKKRELQREWRAAKDAKCDCEECK